MIDAVKDERSVLIHKVDDVPCPSDHPHETDDRDMCAGLSSSSAALRRLRRDPSGGAQSDINAPLTQTLKPSAPESICFANPPVVERLESSSPEDGERVEGQIKYYDYGVVSVIFEVPFRSNWQSLVEPASRWIGREAIASLWSRNMMLVDCTTTFAWR